MYPATEREDLAARLSAVLNGRWDELQSLREENTRLRRCTEEQNAAMKEGSAEIARLQRVVDDLADALRKANRRLVSIARLAQRDAVDPQAIYNESYSGEVRGALDRHGLLRPADRPELVPESMRAGASE